MADEQQPFQTHRFDLQQMLKELTFEMPPVMAGTTLLSQARIVDLFEDRQKGGGRHG